MKNWKKIDNPEEWRIVHKWVETEVGERTGNSITVEKEQVTEMGLPDEYMYQVKYNGADIGKLHRTEQNAREAAEEIISRGPRKLINSGFDWSKIF